MKEPTKIDVAIDARIGVGKIQLIRKCAHCGETIEVTIKEVEYQPPIKKANEEYFTELKIINGNSNIGYDQSSTSLAIWENASTH